MERFIDPKTLARVKDMPLIARTVADGFLHGLNASRQRGVGIEFNQYRSYEPGDDPGRIDWKLFARSDRYFVREAERESEIDVWFLLDASGSMQLGSQGQSSGAEPRWNKSNYARHLIATLAYLAQRQGDSVGFLSLSSRALEFLPAANGERHWRRLLQVLSQNVSGDYFPPLNLLTHYLNQMTKPSLIFVLSDFHQRQSEITHFISQLNTSRSEVVALKILCDDEIEFNYSGAIRFKDLETQQEILLSAGDLKAAYLQAFNHYQESIEEKLRQSSVASYLVNIDQPLDQVLYEYLKQRQRMAG
jgi:uncharacterized protein (DUF58 family)